MKALVIDSSHLVDRLDVAFYLARDEVSEFFGDAPVSMLSELCDPVKTRTPPAELATEAGTRCVKLRNVRGSVLDMRNCDHISAVSAGEFISAEQFDLLVTATGEGTVGRVDIFTESVPGVVTGEVMLLRPRADKIDPFYLLAAMRTRIATLQLTKFVRGATGQTHLYWQDISAMPIPLVDKGEQKAIRLLIEKAIKLQRQAEKASDDAARLTEKLVVEAASKQGI